MDTIRYELNEGVFDQWSEESSYALGYLFADGSVYVNPKGGSMLIISGSRLENLSTIKRILGSGHPINQVGPSSWEIRIGSATFVEKLQEIGLMENKSVNLTYPDVPREWEPAFIRGYFDGKGSFQIERGRRITSGFSCLCYPFLEVLRDRLVLHGLNEVKINYQGTNRIRYYVSDTDALYRLLYDGARIYSSEQRGRYEQGCKN